MEFKTFADLMIDQSKAIMEVIAVSKIILRFVKKKGGYVNSQFEFLMHMTERDQSNG